MSATKTYKVSHILLQHKYEAEDILIKLNSGASFENLAKKFSICSSAKNEGLLGVLKLGQADADFEEATIQLEIGKTSAKPIRTKFGYHIIKRWALV